MKRLLFAVGLVAVVATMPGCWVCGDADTAARQAAKQTVFNADKHVWTYEEFYRKFENYRQFDVQESTATELLKVTDPNSPRYGSLSMEADGARQMKYRIAAEYNKMSDVAYQSIWRGRGLPSKLGE